MRWLAVTIVLLGCARSQSTSSDPPSSCTKLGAPCTFAPGKLGSCVEVEQANGGSTFVCQSQH